MGNKQLVDWIPAKVLKLSWKCVSRNMNYLVEINPLVSDLSSYKGPCAKWYRQKRHSGKMRAHAPQIYDSSVNRLRMLHFNRQIHTCYHNMFFLLNKICDGGSSKEPFLKAATLSILIRAYPRETKTNNGILKMPPFCRVRFSYPACALILPLCRQKPEQQNSFWDRNRTDFTGPKIVQIRRAFPNPCQAPRKWFCNWCDFVVVVVALFYLWIPKINLG